MAGVILVDLIKKSPKNMALVLALQGNLGSGKTTLTQGISKTLGVRGRVASPTFIIMRNYKLLTINHKRLYHFDCYRLEKPEDVLELGFQDIISNPKNIVVIEWPEKIKQFLPKQTLSIQFKFINEKTREIKI